MSNTQSFQFENSEINNNLDINNFFSVVEHSPDMIAVLKDKKFIYINDAGITLLGLTQASDILKKNYLDFIHPAYHKTDVELFQQMNTKQQSADYIEKKIVRPDGEVLDVEIALSPLNNNENDYIFLYVKEITELKHYQEERESSERKFKMLFELAPDPCLLCDLKGYITEGNKALENITGFHKSEFIGVNIFKFDLVPTDHMMKITELFFYNARGQSAGPVDLEIVKKNDKKVSIELRTFPFRSRSQLFVFCIMRDITERKIIEEELESHRHLLEDLVEKRTAELKETNEQLKSEVIERQKTQKAFQNSEEQYRRVVENAWDSIVVIQDWYLKFFNPRTIEITGYLEEELLSKPFLDFVHPDEKNLLKKHYIDCLNGQSFYDVFSFRIMDKGGIIRWLETKMVVITWNEQLAVLLFMSDITTRKRTEERLKLSAAVFENATEGIIITDQAGIIISVNSAFSVITGYEKEEIIGKKPSILKSGKHDNAFYEQMWKSLSVDHHWQGEIWNKRKNQEIYPSWLSIAAVLDDYGKVIRYTAVMSDITLRKNREELIKYKAYHDSLTGLPNRELFKHRLNEIIKQAEITQKFVVIMFVDLDGFKTINDTMGHYTGDRLLQQVAKILKHTIRKEDTVARFGGDEFILLLPSFSDKSDINRVAEKILNEFQNNIVIDEQKLKVTTSIGISIYPQDSTDQDKLIEFADIAMYKAKEKGKNNFQYYHKSE